MVHARSHRLDLQAHRLVRHVDETLDPQDVLGFRGGRNAGGQRFGIRDGRQIDDKAVKIVVIVVELVVVMRLAVFDIVLDGKAEAIVIATACSPVPDGRATWTARMLANRLVELQVVESVSEDTILRVLKKASSSRGRRRRGACPKG